MEELFVSLRAGKPKKEKIKTLPPEELLEDLTTICNDWPRRTSYDEKQAIVSVLCRPEDLWGRMMKFEPNEDPTLMIRCAMGYLDSLDERPKDYRGLIPNVCAMTNFFGEKALWKRMISEVQK